MAKPRNHNSIKAVEKKLNIILAGAERVGKTAIAKAMLNEKLKGPYEPTSLDIYEHKTVIHNSQVTVKIIDTNGENVFSTLQKEMISKSDVLVIVFALNNLESYEKAKQLYERVSEENTILPIFVGSKAEFMSRKFPTKRNLLNEFREKFDAQYLQFSAKFDNGRTLLYRLFEEVEINRGPYKVTKVCMKK